MTRLRTFFARPLVWVVIVQSLTALAFFLTAGAGVYIALRGEPLRALLLALFSVILLVANHLGDPTPALRK